MSIAVIDLGTNTFNLLIAKVHDDGGYTIKYNNKLPVKLGEGGINKGLITSQAIQRGMETLRYYDRVIKEHSASQVYAFGTSALRSCRNGPDFVKEVKKQFDIDVKVIDGDEEAELIYAGVLLALDLGEENVLIMDIGGGSTEFIIGNRREILWKRSFELGAARLLDKFEPSDPIKEEEVIMMERYLEVELRELFEALKIHRVETLTGSSGSFDTLAEMIAHRFYTPAIFEDKTEFTFHLPDYFIIHRQLLHSTKEERLSTPGIIELRVDMIVIASIFVNFILKKCRIHHMRLSTYSLKEGVLNKIIKGEFNLDK